MDYFEELGEEQSPILTEAKTMLFMIYETISDNTKYIINNHDFFIKVLIPKLCNKLLP